MNYNVYVKRDYICSPGDRAIKCPLKLYVLHNTKGFMRFTTIFKVCIWMLLLLKGITDRSLQILQVELGHRGASHQQQRRRSEREA